MKLKNLTEHAGVLEKAGLYTSNVQQVLGTLPQIRQEAKITI